MGFYRNLTLLLLHSKDECNDGCDDAQDGRTGSEEGVEGTALDGLALVGLDVDEVVLLDVVGRALEDVGVGEVDVVLPALAILFAIEGYLLAQAGIGDVAAAGQDVEDGVALAGEVDDLRVLDGSEHCDAGIEQANGHLGVFDEVGCDDALLDATGCLVGGEASHRDASHGWQDDEAFVADGIAIGVCHGAGGGHVLGTGVASGTHRDVLCEDAKQSGLGTGDFDENLVGGLESHLVLLHDFLSVLEHLVGVLEIDNLLC